MSIIAHATSFSYEAGILCYSTSTELRILDLNTSSAAETVINGKLFTQLKHQSMASEFSNLPYPRSMTIPAHTSNSMTVICQFGGPGPGHFLFAVRFDEEEPEEEPVDGGTSTTGRQKYQILLLDRLPSIHKLFVRQNSDYLYYGTYSAQGSHGHHEWLIRGFDLRTSQQITPQPLQLCDFVGSEIGSTVCFTLHDGYFYALTNQTSFESEEVDWTSYYHYIRFPVDTPEPELKIKMIWRRQHLEGPINDAWTDLSFQVDEQTGELLIVECRKEWIRGGSRSVRTYYTQAFERAEHLELWEALRHPPDDQLSRTLDQCSRSRWSEPVERIDKYVHTEFGGVEWTASGATKEYLRAKTKWNGYSFNARSFIDLVAEDMRVEGEWRPRERLRLRVVSSLENSSLVLDIDRPGGMRIREKRRDREGENICDSEEGFGPSRVYLWPAGEDDGDDDRAPLQALNDLLCPSGRAGDIKAVLGDQGIVYMAGGPLLQGGGGHRERALVFISFDPSWGFEGMKSWRSGTLVRPRRTAGLRERPDHGKNRKRRSEGEPRMGSVSRLDEDRGTRKVKRRKSQIDSGYVVDTSTDSAAAATSSTPPSASTAGPAVDSASKRPPSRNSDNGHPLVYTEPATYTQINQAFWFR